MPRRKIHNPAQIKNRFLATIDEAMIRIEKAVRTGTVTENDLEQMKLLASIFGNLEEKVQNTLKEADKKEKQLSPEEVEKLLGK